MYCRAFCAWLGAVGMLWSLQSDSQPDALLARITERTRQNLSQLPDYVCTQTIERTRRRGPDAQFQPLDTLRVEVGLVGDHELYSWPGANGFAEKELAEMIGRGVVGTGNFALLAKHLFVARVAQFTARGEEVVSGRRLIRYDYEVPRESSSYKIRVAPHQATVGFEGSFWVDSGTLDLVRLDVRSQEIPAPLGLTEVATVVQYAQRLIGDSSFLLPASSELRMRSVSGEEYRSEARLTPCRKYVAESSLSFSEPPPKPERLPSSGAPQRWQLPARASMELSLDADIDLETAVVGDFISAVLARPLKDGDRVIVPEGAKVFGRLVRLEKQTLPFEYYVVGLQFHTLTAGDQKGRFVATMESAGPASGMIQQAKRMNPTFKRQRGNRMEILVQEQHAGQGIIHWQAKHQRIPKALKMRWRIDRSE